MTQPEQKKLLTESEAAQFLTVSVAALRAWRFRGKGPLYLKLGAAVRYRPVDLQQYLDAVVVDPRTPRW